MPEILRDIFDRRIRLTDERARHITAQHSYMAYLLPAIGETLLEPEEIRRSLKAPESARVYCKWYHGTIIGDKWLRVVVKIPPDDAFGTTPFASNEIERGELIWPSGKDSN